MRDTVMKCSVLNKALGLLQLSGHLLQTMWREAKAFLRGS